MQNLMKILINFLILHLGMTQSTYENPIQYGQKHTFVFNEESFSSLIQLSLGQDIWLVMLFSPECKYCDQFKPTFYNSVYDFRNAKIKFGEVNCLNSSSICNTLKIKYYPFMMYFHGGQMREYKGQHNLMGIKFFLEKGWQNSDPSAIPLEEPTYWSQVWEGLIEMKDEIVQVLQSQDDSIQKGIAIVFISILVTIVFVFLYFFYECFKLLRSKDGEELTTQRKLGPKKQSKNEVLAQAEVKKKN